MTWTQERWQPSAELLLLQIYNLTFSLHLNNLFPYVKSSYHLYLLHLWHTCTIILHATEDIIKDPEDVSEQLGTIVERLIPAKRHTGLLPEFHHPHLPWIFIACVWSNSWTYDDLVIFDTISIWMTSFPYSALVLMIPLDTMVPKDPFAFF